MSPDNNLICGRRSAQPPHLPARRLRRSYADGAALNLSRFSPAVFASSRHMEQRGTKNLSFLCRRFHVEQLRDAGAPSPHPFPIVSRETFRALETFFAEISIPLIT
jgi:hypothetical protein